MSNQTFYCWIDDKFWIWKEGKILVLEDKPKIKSATGALSRSQSPTIEAPMPGRVTKVHKTANSEVQEGEVVISMEAMKMEYTLKAPTTGIIKNLFVGEGDQVELGAVLAEIEPASKSG